VANQAFEIYKFSEAEMAFFLLLLVRISCFLATWPIFGGEQVGARTKILFGLTMTICSFGVLYSSAVNPGLRFDEALIFLTLKEALVGVVLGFTARLFFFVISMAGEMVSVSMGLSSEQLFNPIFSGGAGAMGQFYVILGSLLFLALGGHHLFLKGFFESFDVMPVTDVGLNTLGATQIMQSIGGLLASAVKMAAPIMASIFVLNVGLAITNRAIPQINILITSLSVNILAGLLILILILPLMVTSLGEVLRDTSGVFFSLMRSL